MFHFCGDLTHDVVANTLVVLNLLPEWLPCMQAARSYLKRKHIHT